jgi:hypothetical protein
MVASREIQFWPDWGHRWPLWGSVVEDELCLTPTDLSLSEALTVDLRAWWDFWDAHLQPDPPAPQEPGWDSDQNRRVWLAAGHMLATRLAEEIGPAHQVRAQFVIYE